jgi:hypothetical protein
LLALSLLLSLVFFEFLDKIKNYGQRELYINGIQMLVSVSNVQRGFDFLVQLLFLQFFEITYDVADSRFEITYDVVADSRCEL